MANSRLSKSTFIRGLQCEKSLYLYKHHYKLKDPTPTSLQAVFDHGSETMMIVDHSMVYDVEYRSTQNMIAEAMLKLKQKRSKRKSC